MHSVDQFLKNPGTYGDAYGISSQCIWNWCSTRFNRSQEDCRLRAWKPKAIRVSDGPCARMQKSLFSFVCFVPQTMLRLYIAPSPLSQRPDPNMFYLPIYRIWKGGHVPQVPISMLIVYIEGYIEGLSTSVPFTFHGLVDNDFSIFLLTKKNTIQVMKPYVNPFTTAFM